MAQNHCFGINKQKLRIFSKVRRFCDIHFFCLEIVEFLNAFKFSINFETDTCTQFYTKFYWHHSYSRTSNFVNHSFFDQQCKNARYSYLMKSFRTVRICKHKGRYKLYVFCTITAIKLSFLRSKILEIGRQQSNLSSIMGTTNQ